MKISFIYKVSESASYKAVKQLSDRNEQYDEWTWVFYSTKDLCPFIVLDIFYSSHLYDFYNNYFLFELFPLFSVYATQFASHLYSFLLSILDSHCILNHFFRRYLLPTMWVNFKKSPTLTTLTYLSLIHI